MEHCRVWRKRLRGLREQPVNGWESLRVFNADCKES